ncbi:MAG: hypothetical protein KDD28_13150 [Phaeodactylibacter sp.]|nr:hypothetical protein [Phaeodactylibacter sp.]
MNPKFTLTLFLGIASCSPNFAQEDTLDLSATVTSITINWTWQTQNGDTTLRDFCLLEFALPAEALAGAYCFKLEGLQVRDNFGRTYQSNAFAVSAGEQSLQRDYRLLEQQDGKEAAPRFRVRIENPKKNIEYFTLEGRMDVVYLSGTSGTVQEYSTLDWQTLYESLLPHGVQLVFAAQSRSMMEQMANLGSMSAEGQERLNVFMETNSMYLQEPLFPENTNFLLDDPDKRVLKMETIGADGQPIPYQERRSYTGGVLYLQQQYEAPLNGRERVRVLVATDEARKSIPIKMERVRLPW